jgi:hypothetical protein
LLPYEQDARDKLDVEEAEEKAPRWHRLRRAPAGAEHLDAATTMHHDALMRTTVTLDADVVRSLKDEAHRTRRSFKAALNDAVRRGLAPVSPGRKRRYRVKAHQAKLAAGIDSLRLNQLADEFEDAASGLG